MDSVLQLYIFVCNSVDLQNVRITFSGFLAQSVNYKSTEAGIGKPDQKLASLDSLSSGSIRNVKIEIFET